MSKYSYIEYDDANNMQVSRKTRNKFSDYEESGVRNGIRWEFNKVNCNYYILLEDIDVTLFPPATIQKLNRWEVEDTTYRHIVYSDSWSKNGISFPSDEFMKRYKEKVMECIDIIYNSYALDGKKYLESEEEFKKVI